MFLVASSAAGIIDKEVASDFKQCERMNGFKSKNWKVQSNAEKAQCKFCRFQIRTHRSDLNIHDVSNKHPRNAVPHYTMRQNGDWLNFDCQKSSDSSDQLFRFAFVNS